MPGWDEFPPGYDPMGGYVTPEMIRTAPPDEELEEISLPQPDHDDRPDIDQPAIPFPFDFHPLASFPQGLPATGPVHPLDVMEKLADEWLSGRTVVLTGQVFQIVGGSYNRKRLVIVVSGVGAVRVGPLQAQAAVGYELDPADAPFVMTHTGEVWGYAVADSAVSWYQELYHDMRQRPPAEAPRGRRRPELAFVRHEDIDYSDDGVDPA